MMEPPQYILPKVGVLTNQAELRMNRQRLLKEHYQKKDNSNTITRELNQRRNQTNTLSELNPFKIVSRNSEINPMIERSYSQPRVNRNVHDDLMKNSLSNELNYQIAMKQTMKKQFKNQDLMLQKKLMQKNQLLEKDEYQKDKNFYQNFKQEAIDNIKMKDFKKESQKLYESLEKKHFDMLFKQGYQIVEKRKNGFDDRALAQPLSLSFKRNSVSSFQNYHDNPQTGIVPKVSNHKPNFEEATNLRKKLRQTLLQQMRMKEEQRQNQKIKKLNTQFVDQKYKNLDNPIFNPVDIKIAKDNPYVMKELLKQKMSVNKSRASGDLSQRNQANSAHTQGQSYLSRRGSSSLSKLTY